MRQKKYEELTFTDDYIFWKVLTTHLELCRELLEIILDREIVKIVYAYPQKTIEESSDARGVRLDIYAEGETETYNIEMQAYSARDLPKRTRYYQGMIDLDLLEKGRPFSELKQTYVIFICTFDPFGEGLPRYTFENICRERPALQLNDESCKIFVNGAADHYSGRLGELIRYLSGQVTGAFSRSLDSAVKEVRQSKDGRREYMTLFMRDIEKREEGRIEGLAEGRAEERKNIIFSMLKADLPREQIYSCGITEEELAEAEREVLQRT